MGRRANGPKPTHLQMRMLGRWLGLLPNLVFDRAGRQGGLADRLHLPEALLIELTADYLHAQLCNTTLHAFAAENEASHGSNGCSKGPGRASACYVASDGANCAAGGDYRGDHRARRARRQAAQAKFAGFDDGSARARDQEHGPKINMERRSDKVESSVQRFDDVPDRSPDDQAELKMGVAPGAPCLNHQTTALSMHCCRERWRNERSK